MRNSNAGAPSEFPRSTYGRTVSVRAIVFLEIPLGLLVAMRKRSNGCTDRRIPEEEALSTAITRFSWRIRWVTNSAGLGLESLVILRSRILGTWSYFIQYVRRECPPT